MNKTPFPLVIFFCLALTLSALVERAPCLQTERSSLEPPKTVPYVNLTRYLGIWYEQASIPARFSSDCLHSMANYTFNEDGSIKVINTCYQDGASRSLQGRAVPDPSDTQRTNAKLKVKFPTSPVAGDYWVVRLDDSYSYAVVGGPTYAYLWILYRSPVMPDDMYNALIADLKADGFPVEKLKRDTY